MHVNQEHESTEPRTDLERAVRLMAEAVTAGRMAALCGDEAEAASCRVIIRRAAWFAAFALHHVPVFAEHRP